MREVVAGVVVVRVKSLASLVTHLHVERDDARGEQPAEPEARALLARRREAERPAARAAPCSAVPSRLPAGALRTTALRRLPRGRGRGRTARAT